MDKNSVVHHGIPPVFDKNSRILILGSFPSVKSRENMFFYGHHQNRFWVVLSRLFDAPVPVTTDEKKSFLLFRGIALWDVIESCEIVGSADSSIRNVVPNDISQIIASSSVKKIFTNGRTAEKFYNKFIKPQIGISAVPLPSTSPANASYDVDALLRAWRVIKE